MYSYRPLDDALARAVLVGATPEQRAWLGGASGDERQLDGAEAAAAELFLRAMARTAQPPECRRACADALAFVHGNLPRRRRQAVAAHHEACADCAWTIEMLPGIADGVGTVASVYADAMIGPPEAPAGAQRRPVPTAARRSRRPAIAVAATAVLGLAGVGAAVAQGWRSSEEPLPVVVEEDVPFEDPTSSHEPTPPSTTEPTPDEAAEPSDAPSDAAATPGTAVTPGNGVWRPAGGGTTPSAPGQQSVPTQPAGPEAGPGESASGGQPTTGSPATGGSTTGGSTSGGSAGGGAAGDNSTGGSTSGGQEGTNPGGTETAGTQAGGEETTAPPSGDETTEPPGTGPEPSTDPTEEPATPGPDPTATGEPDGGATATP